MKIISDYEIDNMTKNSQKSELWEYKESIEKMRMVGITYKAIQEWLRDDNIFTSVENIRQFYLRNCSVKTTKESKEVKHINENKLENMFGKLLNNKDKK